MSCAQTSLCMYEVVFQKCLDSRYVYEPQLTMHVSHVPLPVECEDILHGLESSNHTTCTQFSYQRTYIMQPAAHGITQAGCCKALGSFHKVDGEILQDTIIHVMPSKWACVFCHIPRTVSKSLKSWLAWHNSQTSVHSYQHSTQWITMLGDFWWQLSWNQPTRHDITWDSKPDVHYYNIWLLW